MGLCLSLSLGYHGQVERRESRQSVDFNYLFVSGKGVYPGESVVVMAVAMAWRWPGRLHAEHQNGVLSAWQPLDGLDRGQRQRSWFKAK